ATVTGVQTCALPISLSARTCVWKITIRMFSPRELREASKATFDKHSFEWVGRGRADSGAQANRRRYPFLQFSWCLLNVLLVASRSEERRVGKECMAR